MSLQSVNASRVSMECKASSRARHCPESSKEPPDPTIDYNFLQLIKIEFHKRTCTFHISYYEATKNENLIDQQYVFRFPH